MTPVIVFDFKYFPVFCYFFHNKIFISVFIYTAYSFDFWGAINFYPYKFFNILCPVIIYNNCKSPVIVSIFQHCVRNLSIPRKCPVPNIKPYILAFFFSYIKLYPKFITYFFSPIRKPFPFLIRVRNI